MDIAEVAKQSGLPASTLRYYEEKGLIASVGRHGLRRRFDPAVVEQLALISLGQAAGFSLDEIAGMFTAERQPRIDRKKLEAKADQVDAMIKRLRAMSRGLRHAANCPAPRHMECPSFRRLIKAASDGTLAGLPHKKARKTD
ncbi:MAG: h16 [Paucimonas sp.]|nr:h16 [Paucimonas sp.]